MTLDEIQDMWRKDSSMDQDLLCEESLRVPQLHMKYHELYNTFFMMNMYNLLVCGKTFEQVGILRRTWKMISETWLTDKKRESQIVNFKKSLSDSENQELTFNYIKYNERRW